MGAIKQRLKAFDERIIEITSLCHSTKLFLCYSSKEATICKHTQIDELTIQQRFFKVSSIKSVLNPLVIKKIAFAVSNDRKLTLAVLVNDDSLYIYENILLDDRNGLALIQLTKHIHPIEQRDLHGRHLKRSQTSELNNSKCFIAK